MPFCRSPGRSSGDLNAQVGPAVRVDQVGLAVGEGEGQLGITEPPHEQPLLHVAADDGAAGEERIAAPQAVELGVVVLGIGVEVGRLEGRGAVRDVEDAQSAAVVRLEEQVALDVEVVVDRVRPGGEGRGHEGRGEVGDVEDARGRGDAEGLLVHLVVEVGVLAVVADPHLVREGRRGVGRGAEQGDRGLVRDVEDVQRGLPPPEESSTAAKASSLPKCGPATSQVMTWTSWTYLVVYSATWEGALGVLRS